MIALHALLLSLASIGVGETVLLDFSGDCCVPCRQMQPLVEQLTAEGHPIRVIDMSREPELAKRHGVEAMPTFVMLVDGREVDRSVGATSRERLLAMLAKARPEAAPRGAGGAAGRDNPSPRLTDWQSPSPADQPALPLRTASVPLNLYAYPSAPRSQGGALEQRLLAATARLRVDDSQGGRGQMAYSFGTGTIIDEGDGEALILTCAHIFRDSKGKGAIGVDLFCPGGPRGIPGKLIGYNMERDVALVAIRPGMPVSAVPVAPVGYRPRRGEPVISIGCNRGADPTVQKSHVTDTDRVRMPPTTQVAGQPVVGRSGGGLFNAAGEIIGVCYAADPQDNQGLYAALGSIHSELDRKNLAFVYQQRSPSESIESRLGQTRAPELPHELPANLAAAQQQAAENLGRSSATPLSGRFTPADFERLTSEERAVLSAVDSGNVSPQFLQQLADRAGQDASLLTSRRIEQQAPASPPPGLIPQRLPRSWGE
jgi:thiol-disulfide isomerase/thioredoxin